MRVAQLTSPQAPVSPWADGHVERRAGLLADGLVHAGDEVTLLAPEGSQTSAHLVSSPLNDQPDLYALVEHLMGAARVIDGADVVHDHTDVRALITAVNGHPWIVHTLRNSSNGAGPLQADLGRINLVAPTHHQATRHSGLDFAAVIHDGIRIDDHPLVRHRDGHLAYVGPARPEGGRLMGTPVSVFEHDGVEEFVADGVTGFVVPAGDAPAMADAVDRADTIDPATCRSWVAAPARSSSAVMSSGSVLSR